jgi:hypothetical protein
LNPLHPLLLSFLIASPGQSAENPLGAALEATTTRFEKAYLGRNLNSFSNPGGEAVKVTIEHSLIEPPEGVQAHTFSSFAAFETWLRSKEHGGHETGEDLLPNREARSRKLVRPGLLEYDNQGISHNTLYLSQIRFTQSGRSIAIIEVVLYDGD